MTVPVRKPNPQDFSRVHPDPAYRMEFAVIDLKDDRELFYLLTPTIAQQLPGECVSVICYTTINRQGVVYLWPATSPIGRSVNEWHRSAMEAAERAMSRWVRVKANMGLGAYEMFEAASSIPDPTWPEHSFHELLEIAFRDRLVNSLDHPVIKRLLGQA